MSKSKQTWQFNPVRPKIVEHRVHLFSVGGVADPDMYAAHPIWEWENTEQGRWVMQNSNPKPKWERYIDPHTYGYKYVIKAYFTPEQVTYWKLKYE
jgi:hypothetical protein